MSLISFSHSLSIVEKDYSLISYNSSSLSVRDLWLCPYPAMTAFGLAPGKGSGGHCPDMTDHGSEKGIRLMFAFSISSHKIPLKLFPMNYLLHFRSKVLLLTSQSIRRLFFQMHE